MNINLKNLDFYSRLERQDNRLKKTSSTPSFLSENKGLKEQNNAYCSIVPPQVIKWVLGGLAALGGSIIAYKQIPKLIHKVKLGAVDKADNLAKTKKHTNPLLDFPEFKKWQNEITPLHARNCAKIDAATIPMKGVDFDMLDIQYFKDEFRLTSTVPAEKLKMLRESTDPKMKDLINTCRGQFWLCDGVMIHGTNRPEKQELFNYFLNQAKKHDFDIIHIKAGDSDAKTFHGKVMDTFIKAKEKFVNEYKHTMVVMDGPMDKLLAKENGEGRYVINIHTHKCGESGVTWLSMADDITKLDESSIRGGRIAYKINIDKALEASKKANDVK